MEVLMVNMIGFAIVNYFAFIIVGCIPWIYPLVCFDEDVKKTKEVEKKFSRGILFSVAIATFMFLIAVICWQKNINITMEEISGAPEFLRSMPWSYNLILILTFIVNCILIFRSEKKSKRIVTFNENDEFGQ